MLRTLGVLAALAMGHAAAHQAVAYDRPAFEDDPAPLNSTSRTDDRDRIDDARASPKRSARERKIVCGMTINSQDEVKAFIEKLRADRPGSDFEFVELTKMGSARNWFEKAGQSGVECDILLISAHFGGTLFGDNNKIRLPLSALEEASCRNTHDGILKHPKEVFLFTCNMLAGKQRDTRTPREYYQVLLEYYPPHIAQYYVQTRYGAWGGTFVGRTLRTFYGVPRIYGYNSVSPLGAASGAWVRRYLAAIADYGKHLEGVTTKTTNQTLIRTIGYTGMMQKSGVQPGTLGDKVRTNLCDYFNAGSTEGKLSVLARNLRLQNFEPYLTYVEEFYREHEPHMSAAHRDIQGNTRVKSHVLKMIEVSVDMPHTRIDLVNFANQVGWIDDGERKAYLEKIIRDLFAGATTADKVFDVCSVGSRHRKLVGKYVNLEFLESVRPSSQWDYRYLEMVGCLRPQGAPLQDKVAGYLDNKHGWKYRWAAAYTFLDTEPKTDYVRRMLVQAAHDPHRAVRQTARQAAKNWKLKAPEPLTRRRPGSTPEASPSSRPLAAPAPNTAAPDTAVPGATLPGTTGAPDPDAAIPGDSATRGAPDRMGAPETAAEPVTPTAVNPDGAFRYHGR